MKRFWISMASLVGALIAGAVAGSVWVDVLWHYKLGGSIYSVWRRR